MMNAKEAAAGVTRLSATLNGSGRIGNKSRAIKAQAQMFTGSPPRTTRQRTPGRSRREARD